MAKSPARKSLTDCKKDFQDKINQLSIESSATHSKSESIFGKGPPNLAFLTAGETPEFVASPGRMCPTPEKRSTITLSTIKSVGKYRGKIVRRSSSSGRTGFSINLYDMSYDEAKFEDEAALQHIGGIFCTVESLSEDIMEDPEFEEFFGFVLKKNEHGLNDLTDKQIDSILDNFKRVGITAQFKQLMDRYCIIKK